MSEKVSNGYSKKCLIKYINRDKVYLYKSFSIMQGYGWFCHIYHDNRSIGFGFHKTNKFSAVRQGLIDL